MAKNIAQPENIYPRRKFLSAALAMPILISNFSSRFQQPHLSEILSATSLDAASGDINVISPNGRIQFQLLTRDVARLSYHVLFNNQPAIETARMGIIVDGVD